ncbi:flagellar hook-basal body complex protein FliE [Planktomarina temperata]|jgi:flagellar hook-basal body complex protein FliE|nr:flagellar hook-basal body complex protein FliE [Planktomarina temperata]MDB4854535.1 flagellar hook-basal body complex protein FliE [Planktomarina temperata]
MKIQSSNITAVNTNMSSVKQKAQLSAEALQAKSVEAGPSFSQRISDGLDGVAHAQNTASQLARDYELGTENDLSKVMINQQISSVGFQLTLNIRNKALSAYKDIMNMPV